MTRKNNALWGISGGGPGIKGEITLPPGLIKQLEAIAKGSKNECHPISEALCEEMKKAIGDARCHLLAELNQPTAYDVRSYLNKITTAASRLRSALKAVEDAPKLKDKSAARLAAHHALLKYPEHSPSKYAREPRDWFDIDFSAAASVDDERFDYKSWYDDLDGLNGHIKQRLRDASPKEATKTGKEKAIHIPKQEWLAILTAKLVPIYLTAADLAAPPANLVSQTNGKPSGPCFRFVKKVVRSSISEADAISDKQLGNAIQSAGKILHAQRKATSN